MRNFVTRINYFHANFVLRTCHPEKLSSNAKKFRFLNFGIRQNQALSSKIRPFHASESGTLRQKQALSITFNHFQAKSGTPLKRYRDKRRPNHDHNHFWVHLAGRHSSFLGYPRMTHQMPLLHSGTQRNHKDFSSDVPSNDVWCGIRCKTFLENHGCGCVCRAALKGTNLRGQMPICGFLRVPAKICGFLRQSAVFCENLRFPNALFSGKRRESAKICENLRLGSVCPLRFVPLSAPWVWAVPEERVSKEGGLPRTCWEGKVVHRKSSGCFLETDLSFYWQCKYLMYCIFPVLKPLAYSRQSRCRGWTYKLPGCQKFSIELSALSVGFPQRRPSNLIKRPQFINSPGVRFKTHPACSL